MTEQFPVDRGAACRHFSFSFIVQYSTVQYIASTSYRCISPFSRFLFSLMY